jgi:hypothetical protein
MSTNSPFSKVEELEVPSPTIADCLTEHALRHAAHVPELWILLLSQQTDVIGAHFPAARGLCVRVTAESSSVSRLIY